MFYIKKNKGFSLAEMMVVMLMLSIIFAAAAPILTKRATQTAEVKASTGSSVPVGTVIMWMSTTLPQGDEAGKWLECNGATFSATTYPDLKVVLGSTTLPNFIGRVAQGNSTPKTLISAGLPNITGTFTAQQDFGWYNPKSSGALYNLTMSRAYGHADWGYYGNSASIGLDASRSSSIYGNSTTVQPSAITVKYLIKAKS